MAQANLSDKINEDTRLCKSLKQTSGAVSAAFSNGIGEYNSGTSTPVREVKKYLKILKNAI